MGGSAMSHGHGGRADLIILMPVYEDWKAVGMLLTQFAAIRGRLPERVHFLLVDDGSASRPPPGLAAQVCDEATSLEILPLARNLGHQRAIAVGLCHVHESFTCRGIVVMDCDGEDPPSAIPTLLERSYAGANDRVVFAARKRRSEGVGFSFFYHIYRWLHWILTGVRVRVGNFSYLPRDFVHRLAVAGELWNHYAAAVFVSRIPYITVPVPRAHRLEGRSRMNFVGLMSHGLAAISVFSAAMGARILIASTALLLTAAVLLAALVAAHALGALAIPGWATLATGFLLLLITQVLTGAAAFAFMVLGGRSGAEIIPLRDYRYFLGDRQGGGEGR